MTQRSNSSKPSSSRRRPSRLRRIFHRALPPWALIALVLIGALALPMIQGEAPVDFGLDLSGGTRVTYVPREPGESTPGTSLPSDGTNREASSPPRDLLDVAKETLASRLARSLDSVPDVVVRSDGRIVVNIPGDQDQRRLLELVGKTYHLTMALVASSDAPARGGTHVVFEGRDLMLEPAAFTGDMLDVRRLQVVTPPPDPRSLQPTSAMVQFELEPPHDEAFADFTREHIGREMAISIDGAVEWVGVIESTIRGPGTLAGNYTLAQAVEVADMLRAGTLPIALEVESLISIGPSLGLEVRALGFESLLLSLGLLVGLLVVAYAHRRRLLATGLASLGCLFLFLLGLIALFDLRLDLAGIAGLVLSIGMGLDAMFIAFEAMEERGVSARSGDVRIGAREIYALAREGGTLFHANATTLLIIMLLLGSERLKSFAVFMAVGAVASVLTILTTRRWLGNHAHAERDTAWGLFHALRRARPRLFRFRGVYVAVVLALVGAVSVGMVAGTGPRLEVGADFRPGAQLELASPSPEALQSALDTLADRLPEASIRHQHLGDDGNRHLVTLGTEVVLETTSTSVSSGSPQERHEDGRIDAREIAELLASEGVELGRIDAVSARVSGQRLLHSLSVLGASILLLGFYLLVLQIPLDRAFGASRQRDSMRSQARVFAGVVLAVLLDVAIVLASLPYLGIAIDLPVVAALLTIIGYSVNDSVVLWTHVRRRAAEHPEASAVEIVTISADRILTRAVLTSISTMIPAITILLVGLHQLASLAWVVIIGTAAGTLSSIFVVGWFAVRALAPSQVPAAAAPADLEVTSHAA